MLMFLLLLVLVLVGTPISAIKLSEYGQAGGGYSTHSFQYLWVASMAYISGELPAGLIIGAWLAVLGSCYVLFVRWEQVDGGMTKVAFSFRSLLGDHSDGTNSTNDMNSNSNSRGRGRGRGISSGSGGSSSSSSGGGGGGGGGAAELIARHRQMSLDERRDAAASAPEESARGYCTLLAVNLLIACTVNIAYVYSVHQPLSSATHVLCQVALALCKTIYNSTILPYLTSRWVKSGSRKIRIRLILSIFNSVFIPGIATTFTSPSCFQNLIVHPDQITSTYFYKYCSLYEFNADGSAGDCMEVTTEAVDVLPMIPPFSYNNLCFSVLLTTYIPVYIFVYSFQAISPFVLVPILTNLEFLSLPRILRKPGVYGLCWPSFWRKQHSPQHSPQHTVAGSELELESDHDLSVCPADEDIATARILFDDKKFYLKIAYHLTILLTFGICSPVLAVIVVLSLVLQLHMLVFLVGRFVDHRLGTRDLGGIRAADDHALRALSTINIDIRNMFEHLIWPLFWGSSLFFAFLSWDIVIDVTGSWRSALWAPVACMSAPLAIWTVICVHPWWTECWVSERKSKTQQKNLLGVDKVRSTDVAAHDSL
jgi:hypothetical protein